LFGNQQTNRETSELFLFLTPHVIFSDTDVDKLREAVKSSSELLQTVPIQARIKPMADTIKIPPIRPDTGRRPPIRPPSP
jgi:type II secretory pathway component GspD/PulD (secretin)